MILTLLRYVINRPMLLCGVICCVISFSAYYSSYLLIPIAFALSAFMFITIYLKLKPTLIIVCVLSIIMLLNTVDNLKNISSYNYADELETTAEFTVLETQKINGNYKTVYGEIKNCKDIKKGTKILINTKDVATEIGKNYKAKLKISTFDKDYQKKNYYSNKTYLYASADDISYCEGKDDKILTEVNLIRNYIKESLFSNLKYEEASTLCALLFGKNDYFTDEFYSNVKAAGVSHIMVVSGMHLAITVALLEKTVNKFFYNRYKRALIILMVIIFIMALCGFTMSIKRAGITYVLVAMSILFGRTNCPENALGGAVTFILIASPFTVFSISFQLSSLATFGIISVANPIGEYLEQTEKINPYVLKFINSVLITLSATLLTLPVIINTYGEISKLTLITNLLVSFAVTAVMWIVIIALVVNLIIPVISEHVLFPISQIITKYINTVINSVEMVENPMLIMPKYTAKIVVAVIVAVFCILLACKNRNNMLKLKEINAKIKREGGRKLKWQ